MSALTEKIQSILRTRIGRVTDVPSERTEEMSENRKKLRDILSDQHRVMYYTVTISSLSSPSLRKDSTNLKWQYASTVYKSQATMRKSTISSLSSPSLRKD